MVTLPLGYWMFLQGHIDIGFVLTPLQTDILLSEIPDTVRPIPTSMFVNFTDGTATFSSSETIDVTPTSNINLSRVELSGSIIHLSL